MSALTSDSPDDLDALRSGKGVLCVMNQTGDTRTVWDPTDTEAVAKVRAEFDALIEAGFQAYSIPAKGAGAGSPEVIHEFPSEATKIVVAPNLVGG